MVHIAHEVVLRNPLNVYNLSQAENRFLQQEFLKIIMTFAKIWCTIVKGIFKRERTPKEKRDFTARKGNKQEIKQSKCLM